MAQDASKAAPTISTHVLDTARGVPAAGIRVTLYKLVDDGRPVRLTQALTDVDGRIGDLLERPLTTGDYRLEFGLERGGFFERSERRYPHRRCLAQPSCSDAALAVLDDDLPGILTG